MLPGRRPGVDNVRVISYAVIPLSSPTDRQLRKGLVLKAALAPNVRYCKQLVLQLLDDGTA